MNAARNEPQSVPKQFRGPGFTAPRGQPPRSSSRLRTSIRQLPAAQPARALGRLQASKAAEPDKPEDDEDEAPSISGDWREYRAQLIAKAAPEGGDPWSARWTQENLHLLQQQDRKLAQEGLWAHATETPETGGLLIATPNAQNVLRSQNYWQLIVLLLDHNEQGSTGIILNRPSSAQVGDLLDWGVMAPKSPEDAEEAGLSTDDIKAAFAESQLYHGGFYAPNQIARQQVLLLHGQSHLPDAQEVAPGMYIGGEVAAAREILADRLQRTSVRFFLGTMQWRRGELQAQIEKKAWYTAACSRSLVLKQCLQLPVPLWREILELMGGEYSFAARRAGPFQRG